TAVARLATSITIAMLFAPDLPTFSETVVVAAFRTSPTNPETCVNEPSRKTPQIGVNQPNRKTTKPASANLGLEPQTVIFNPSQRIPKPVSTNQPSLVPESLNIGGHIGGHEQNREGKGEASEKRTKGREIGKFGENDEA
ncbi:hypothetical protein VIGAN_06065100, partial [Vigna angularis var. angularis]